MNTFKYFKNLLFFVVFITISFQAGAFQFRNIIPDVNLPKPKPRIFPENFLADFGHNQISPIGSESVCYLDNDQDIQCYFFVSGGVFSVLEEYSLEQIQTYIDQEKLQHIELSGDYISIRADSISNYGQICALTEDAQVDCFKFTLRRSNNGSLYLDLDSGITLPNDNYLKITNPVKVEPIYNSICALNSEYEINCWLTYQEQFFDFNLIRNVTRRNLLENEHYIDIQLFSHNLADGSSQTLCATTNLNNKYCWDFYYDPAWEDRAGFNAIFSSHYLPIHFSADININPSISTLIADANIATSDGFFNSIKPLCQLNHLGKVQCQFYESFYAEENHTMNGVLSDRYDNLEIANWQTIDIEPSFSVFTVSRQGQVCGLDWNRRSVYCDNSLILQVHEILDIAPNQFLRNYFPTVNSPYQSEVPLIDIEGNGRSVCTLDQNRKPYCFGGILNNLMNQFVEAHLNGEVHF